MSEATYAVVDGEFEGTFHVRIDGGEHDGRYSGGQFHSRAIAERHAATAGYVRAHTVGVPAALDRAGYEARCAAAGVAARTDAELRRDAYGINHGWFDAENDPDASLRVWQKLGRARLAGADAEAAEASSAPSGTTTAETARGLTESDIKARIDALHRVHTRAAIEEETVLVDELRRRDHGRIVGFAPAGTTPADPTDAGRCAVCGADGWWNAGAGRDLCDGHWDAY